jgi:DNA-binding winged helix-turn-helix (wHTH) protein
MPQPVTDSIAFDDVVIDFAGRRLSRAGIEQALEPKAFAVLALLAGSPGRVFARDEILDSVWGHRHVTQSVLNRIMSLLRQALGEDAQHPRRLHTVHGIGYRFGALA